VLPSKCDHVKVETGDLLLFKTWGGGGWGNPLEREAQRVLDDVINDFVSLESARADYGVVIDEETLTVDEGATAALRAG